MTDMFDEKPHCTIHGQIECVKREIRMREKVYPRWVKNGRMTAQKARDEIESMQAVLDTLEGIQ